MRGLRVPKRRRTEGRNSNLEELRRLARFSSWPWSYLRSSQPSCPQTCPCLRVLALIRSGTLSTSRRRSNNRETARCDDSILHGEQVVHHCVVHVLCICSVHLRAGDSRGGPTFSQRLRLRQRRASIRSTLAPSKLVSDQWWRSRTGFSRKPLVSTRI